MSDLSIQFTSYPNFPDIRFARGTVFILEYRYLITLVRGNTNFCHGLRFAGFPVFAISDSPAGIEFAFFPNGQKFKLCRRTSNLLPVLYRHPF
jgi:hypothetical protein